MNSKVTADGSLPTRPTADKPSKLARIFSLGGVLLLLAMLWLARLVGAFVNAL
jgi:hypothetical protein